MDFLINPNVKQYLYLYIAYAVIVGILAYFLTGGMFAFTGAIATLYTSVELYNMVKHEKAPDLKAISLKSNFWMFFYPMMAFIMILILNHDILFRTEHYVTQKQQLQQTTGIVPAQSSYHRTSGKGGRSYYYLTLNDIKFHCQEEITDACDKIYQYKDKTATIYYQSDTKVGNLVYEIVVDNHKVYVFENQLDFFKKQRNDENMRIGWFFILYFLPVFYFLILYNDVIAQIPEMNEEEKRQYDIEQQEIKERNEPSEQFKRLGILGFIATVIGCLFFVSGLTLLLLTGLKISTVITLILGGGLLYYSIKRTNQYELRQECKKESKRRKNEEISPLNKILSITLLVLFIPFALLVGIFVVASIFNGKWVAFLFWSVIFALVCMLIKNRWQALKK